MIFFKLGTLLVYLKRYLPLSVSMNTNLSDFDRTCHLFIKYSRKVYRAVRVPLQICGCRVSQWEPRMRKASRSGDVTARHAGNVIGSGVGRSHEHPGLCPFHCPLYRWLNRIGQCNNGFTTVGYPRVCVERLTRTVSENGHPPDTYKDGNVQVHSGRKNNNHTARSKYCIEPMYGQFRI